MRTWDDCRKMSQKKARTHSYDDLVDLLSGFAMERENDSDMDKYLRKHLEERPLLKSLPEGGRLNCTLTLERALEAHD